MKKIENNSKDYYQSFLYRIEKKITVEDHPKIKDYAKKGLYLYIIHDNIDNNRFLFITSKHYEDNTKIIPKSFRLRKISGDGESVQLKKLKSKFNEIYFDISDKKTNLSIIFSEVTKEKTKTGKFFKKYKIHTKKIAIDFPDWYLDEINSHKIKSHSKKVLKTLLCNNQYNPQIIEHSISTLFSLNKHELQKFNDHSIIFDEGKTGKSTMIGYFGEKIDNLSIAGLYGSSDSKHGKFRGGLVTTTNKTILIDEINELVEDKKGDKILSVLNSLLENGIYNYQKQFGQKIKASNQFMFMGNISEMFNLVIFLKGTFGNVETIGRRIGIITYDYQLNGFVKGNLRLSTPNIYLESISLFMSNIMNEFLNEPKNITKLYNHKGYKALETFYKTKVKNLANQIEEPTTKQFFKSHSEAIDRIFLRALKKHIFENLDNFINNGYVFNNHTIYEVLLKTKSLMELNLINLQNIKEHIESFAISDKLLKINRNVYDDLHKSHQDFIEFFHLNKDKINQKGINYNDLKNKTLIKYPIANIKRHGISVPLNKTLIYYGCHLEMINNEMIFRFINIKKFENMTEGLFTNTDKKIDLSDDISINEEELTIEEIDMDDDLI